MHHHHARADSPRTASGSTQGPTDKLNGVDSDVDATCRSLPGVTAQDRLLELQADVDDVLCLFCCLPPMEVLGRSLSLSLSLSLPPSPSRSLSLSLALSRALSLSLSLSECAYSLNPKPKTQTPLFSLCVCLQRPEGFHTAELLV
jgi:hypothetical protein